MGSLNHLGVEVESTDLVKQATARFEELGLPIEVQDQMSCCCAVQDKVWVSGPDTKWGFYTVVADAAAMVPAVRAAAPGPIRPRFRSASALGRLQPAAEMTLAVTSHGARLPGQRSAPTVRAPEVSARRPTQCATTG